ncbi:uncharacterized protein [Lolium perenne]|uniref:uncharacterized protein isoform X1 n=2 Tax=Lolium perenne TaxID=4522 RepID=UPI0021F53EE6|nr:uncharacterized protein LOC127299325 isoform X1 [Lolium perenne]
MHLNLILPKYNLSQDTMSSLSTDTLQSTITEDDAASSYLVCVLHFDGASKGNPGKAGAGAVLMTEDRIVISRLREGLGIATNNVAEYGGLILGLKYAIRHGFKRIKVYGDSQLVCYQVQGTWTSRNQKMTELCNEVRGLQANFVSFEMNHVGREWNAEANREAEIAATTLAGMSLLFSSYFRVLTS